MRTISLVLSASENERGCWWVGRSKSLNASICYVAHFAFRCFKKRTTGNLMCFTNILRFIGVFFLELVLWSAPGIINRLLDNVILYDTHFVALFL